MPITALQTLKRKDKTVDNAKRIWDILGKADFSDCGKAGILANIRAESALQSDNVQDSGNRRLDMTDAEYTAAVDNGTYCNFVKDSIGYGLCQWTYWSRKQALRDFAKARGCSVGNLDMQVAFMLQEFKSYGIYDRLKHATSVADATRCMMIEYERPANQSEANVQARVRYGQAFLKQYGKQKSTLDADLAKLVATKVIASPDNWKKIAPTVQYLPELLHNMAEAIR